MEGGKLILSGLKKSKAHNRKKLSSLAPGGLPFPQTFSAHSPQAHCLLDLHSSAWSCQGRGALLVHPRLSTSLGVPQLTACKQASGPRTHSLPLDFSINLSLSFNKSQTLSKAS